MLTSEAARGVANEASTPLRLKSNGPRTPNARQGPSDWTSAGTSAVSHTIDVSAGVRVAEKNGPRVAHAGIASDWRRRQIAYEPGIRSSVSGRVAARATDSAPPSSTAASTCRAALRARAAAPSTPAASTPFSDARAPSPYEHGLAAGARRGAGREAGRGPGGEELVRRAAAAGGRRGGARRPAPS